MMIKNPLNIIEKITDQKIIAVLVINEQKELAPCIESLLEGGIKTIELALRTPYALKAAERISSEYPEMLLGIGTVLNSIDLEKISRFANFAVAPGLNRHVIERAIELDFQFFPGIATPSEVEAALEYDIRLLKFFPAEPLGGLKYLKSMHAPYAHLDVRYIPLGGVTRDNMELYLKSDIIAAIGGTWLAPRNLIDAHNWKEIIRLAKTAVKVSECL